MSPLLTAAFSFYYHYERLSLWPKNESKWRFSRLFHVSIFLFPFPSFAYRLGTVSQSVSWGGGCGVAVITGTVAHYCSNKPERGAPNTGFPVLWHTCTVLLGVGPWAFYYYYYYYYYYYKVKWQSRFRRGMFKGWIGWWVFLALVMPSDSPWNIRYYSRSFVRSIDVVVVSTSGVTWKGQRDQRGGGQAGSF